MSRFLEDGYPAQILSQPIGADDTGMRADRGQGQVAPWPRGKEAIPINDIYHLIDRLEQELSESWQVPLSTYVVVNEEDVLGLIDQMRTAIPQEVRQGEKLLQERDRIIAQAQEEADRLLLLAREDAARLVDEHQIIQAANQRADTIIERSQREAEALRKDADEYAREVLIALDEQLRTLDGQIETLLVTVRNGLKTLLEAREPAPAPPEEP